MQAVILCAGYGTRLKPYTDRYQKTMIPLHGKPLLEYIVQGIKRTGIKNFILVVGYLKEQIYDYFGTGANHGINIEYIEQKKLNGTGGALLLCENSILDNHFFLTWGDILVSYNIYQTVYDIYKELKDDFLLVTNYTDDPHKGGAIYCDGNYCVDYIEKPPKGTSKSNLNNCGIFIFHKKIFEILNLIKPSPRGEVEIPDAITIGIKERKWKVRVLKMKRDDFRADFGDLNTYEHLKKDIDWLKRL